MNKIFVKTTNVKNFIGLVENLINKPKNIPKMGLVYGEPGLGKSQTALWLACKYDGIYLRVTNLMTGRWLLEEIVKELDEIPRFLTSDNFNIVVKKLKNNPQVIFIKHLYDRFSEILKFETFGVNDIGLIINQLSEITFTPETIEYIHTKYNRFRQIVQLINKMETFAKDNNLAEINMEVINQII